MAELEPMLYGLNYCVFLRVYRTQFVSDANAEWYISQALGRDTIVGGTVPVSGPEILAEVEQGLRYAGDAGSGPKPSALQTRRFGVLVPAILAELQQAIAGATLLTQFWLRDGHPAYPVFWDFAFVIAGQQGGLVFIGSCSD